jgi:integrase
MSTKKTTPIVISDEHNEVKIYTVKSRTGTLYQVCHYRAGERHRKTFADLNEAKREARLQLCQLAGERIHARNLSSVEVESYTIATRTLDSIGVPLHVCAELFAETHRVLKGHSILDAAKYYMQHYDPMRVRKPLKELVAEFLESRSSSGVSQRYISLCRYTLQSLKDTFPKATLEDLEAAALEKWLESRSHLTNRSRNTYRVILVCFGNFLKKRGYLPAERPTLFHGICTWKDEIKPVTVYTTDEMRVLLNSAPEPLLPYFAIGAFAGLRTAEIARLDWKHIRFDRGFIECEASMTKTRQRRLVPITDNLRAWLAPIALANGKVVLHSNLGDAAMAYARKCGVRWKRNALRHSYISHRLALMPDTARVALECGNSPDIIFKHYRELVLPDDAKQWFSIVPPDDYRQNLLARRVRKGPPPKWQSAIRLNPPA